VNQTLPPSPHCHANAKLECSTNSSPTKEVSHWELDFWICWFILITTLEYMLCMCVWVCTSVSVESRKYLNKIPPLRLYSKPDLSCDCLVFLHWVKLCKLSIRTTTACICPLYLSHVSTSVGWFSGFLKTHWVWVLQEFTRSTPILYIYIYIYIYFKRPG
jgi:hypothetical protein